ncbi:MAG: hypothetical protein HC850_04235 [Rhodomicrobium sp.]|nr:hypothetical protein [Rhodomicrobium sp.]
MKNITLAVNEEVLAAVRKYAAARDTTVNALVRDYLTRLATFEDRAAKARQELVRLSEASDGRLESDWTWNREDMYDRPILSGHEYSDLRGFGEGEGGNETEKGG